MLMLSLDSSGVTAAAAVTRDGDVIAEAFDKGGLTHSQGLMPMIEKMLAECKVDISEIDEFAFTVGPGSFTGVRIGAALMMGLAGDRPCRPVSTLAALASRHWDRKGIVMAVLDARNSLVYSATFINDGKRLYRFTEDLHERVERARLRCHGNTKQTWFEGSGAALMKKPYARFKNFHFPRKKTDVFVHGADVARAAMLVEPVRAEDVRLNYVKLPQAEIERRKKNESQSRM